MLIIKGRTIKGPYVVTSGLLLYLDAVNPKSYSPNTFPYPLDVYAYTGPNANQATITRDYTIDPSPAGGVPLKMAVTGADPYTVSYNSLAYSFATASQGQTWNISGWLKASTNTTANFYIFGANSTGAWIEIAGDIFSVTTTWQRFETAITFANAATTSIQVRLDGPDSGGAGINIWLDGVQAEKSQSATPFNFRYNQNAATWKDLSVNGNDFTLNGTLQYSTSNGFSGFSQANRWFRNNFPTNLKTSQGGNGYTTCVWAKCTSLVGNWQKLIGNGDEQNYIDLYAESGTARYRQEDGSTLYYNAGINVANNTFVMSDSIWRLYSSTNLNGGTTTNPTDAFGIGSEGDGASNYPWQGNIMVVMIYNRVLTTSELSQNFNALKSRFGVQ